MRRGLLSLAVLAVFGFLGGLASGWLGGGMVQASGPKTIECQTIKFFDEAGTLKAMFGVIAGEPKLAIADSLGKTRISFGIDDAGKPALRLHDAQERPKLHITMVDDQPLILMDDQQGTSRLALTVQRDYGPLVVITDSNDKMIWKAP